MRRRPPRSTLSSSSAASDVYKRQRLQCRGAPSIWWRTAPIHAKAATVLLPDLDGLVGGFSHFLRLRSTPAGVLTWGRGCPRGHYSDDDALVPRILVLQAGWPRRHSPVAA